MEIPDVLIPASQNIDMYVDIIKRLIEKGYAYESSGNIYFDVSKVSNYYDLSGKNADELLVGVRDGVTEDVNKRNPFDFGLWFTTSKFENQAMKWDSPWGVGYPGWHIECTGISIKYLGEHLDIHCGGIDNVFPHHTNEIVQSESYLGHKWCNYWMHGEHLNDSSGKMSKSKGEFLTLSVLKDKGYDSMVYRLFCLQSHYRNQLVFSYEAMDSAKQAYRKLINKVSKIKDNAYSNQVIDEQLTNKYIKLFGSCLENDLNTSSALTVLYDVIKDEHLSDYNKLEIIKQFDNVLSLNLVRDDENTIDKQLEEYILGKIKERNIFKKNGDYNKADMIRQELLERGIILKDGRDGTTYEIK